MNQHIKIWKQSTKILENYEEILNAQNSLKQHAFSIKIVPINISNLITLQGNVKTHAHLTKIDLLGFLKILKMNKIRKKGSHTCFYASSLNHKSTSSLPGQLEPGFPLFSKVLQNYTKITLLNKENTKFLNPTKILSPTLRIPLTNLESHQEHYIGTRTIKPNKGSP